MDRHGLRPRDDNGVVKDALAMTIIGERNGQSLLFTLYPSIFTLLVSSLGSFGPAGLPPCLGQDSPRSLALLAFLETNTEADDEATAAGGAGEALSRTQVRPDVVPGTTPSDPTRARCRSSWIHHRIAGGVSRLVPVRGPFPDISVHIKKAPWVGGKLSDIHRLVRVRTMVPVRIRTGNCITP